ncbi:hypothetical protein DY000_02015670 [Brassica cretica]|uniref:Arabidopsis retrotransposon Orf1 C-terminal domain-containing protein n=1 Tax=Brassica cretica TaxID=69181 RepID=A0ABQ7D5W9_BRACR|nr:hypothetical protein DY000_02015670 [Brassica cretica]
MADGKFCSLSLDKLNEIYYISDERREVAVENKLAPTDRFWDLIANGTFTSRKAYQSQIRNPTLRVIAKIVPTSYSLRIRPRRDCLMRNDNKKDRCGSLLTPMFKYFGINLRSYAVNHEIEYTDSPYLIACHILHDEFTYKFADKEGNVMYCKLPQPHLTNFSTIENIRFLPGLEFMCTDPRAPPPDDDMDDVEDITPDEDAAYELGPLDDDADDATYRRWMVDSQRKNNSLMKKILKAITGGCFGGQEGRTSVQKQTPQQSHRPGK